jgi:hypothetical protein
MQKDDDLNIRDVSVQNACSCDSCVRTQELGDDVLTSHTLPNQHG